MNGKNTAAITSYDLLKGFALLLMVVDHIGAYFYPDDLWWRAFGRMSAPVWFFLVGYSDRREVPPSWMIGAVVLVAADYAAGMALFCLNVLFSLAVMRWLREGMLKIAARGKVALAALTFFLLAMGFHSNLILDYGTIGLLMGLSGALLRRGRRELLLVSWLGYLILCAGTFPFAPAQMLLVAACTACVFASFSFFRPYEFITLSQYLPGPAAALIRLCGRQTLIIYVLHLLILKAILVLSGNAGNPPFTLEFF